MKLPVQSWNYNTNRKNMLEIHCLMPDSAFMWRIAETAKIFRSYVKLF